MTRARGTGRVFQPSFRGRDGKRRKTATWGICYYSRLEGRHLYQYGFRSEAAAERALRGKLEAQDRGERVGPALDRTGFEEMATLLLDDYAANRRSSVARARQSVAHLRSWFGDDLAKHITAGRIVAYKAGRLKEGAAAATVNRELAALKRMFALADAVGLVAKPPKVAMLEERNARKGFFEHEQYEAVLRHLPEDVAVFVRVAYVTGWRRAELLSRQWRHVDFKAGTLRLEPEETKNRDGRMFPLDPDLRPILEAQRDATKALEQEYGRVIPWVFHRGGRRLASFRKVWLRACQEAGVPGRLIHDFRRTAVRNLIRAGVSQAVAMALVGHKTASVFRRYAIVDEGMLTDAAAKLGDLHRDLRRTSRKGAGRGQAS